MEGGVKEIIEGTYFAEERKLDLESFRDFVNDHAFDGCSRFEIEVTRSPMETPMGLEVRAIKTLTEDELKQRKIAELEKELSELKGIEVENECNCEFKHIHTNWWQCKKCGFVKPDLTGIKAGEPST